MVCRPATLARPAAPPETQQHAQEAGRDAAPLPVRRCAAGKEGGRPACSLRCTRIRARIGHEWCQTGVRERASCSFSSISTGRQPTKSTSVSSPTPSCAVSAGQPAAQAPYVTTAAHSSARQAAAAASATTAALGGAAPAPGR